MPLHGHLWTIRPWLLHQLRPRRPPASVRWGTTVSDPLLGPIRLRGWLSGASASYPGGACLVVIHGLGGTSEGHYVLDAAAAADRQQMACLRLDLRGAGGAGDDFYNAALTEDLRAALRSPELSGFEIIHVLGYSLGGHIALRYATEDDIDPRVRAVAAVCPPVDLERSATEIDRPERWLYRQHILGALKAMYAPLASRRTFPLPAREAARISRIREWDERIVAPRFGFASAEAYYAASSVAPRLGRLAVPALLVAAEHDPMVPAASIRPALAGAPERLDVRWLEQGGHVGFPAAVALGFPEPLGLEPQIVAWLRARGTT